MWFHDSRFASHPRFQYFVLNLMMHHHSQGIALVFVKKNAEDCIPTTIETLCTHMQEFPDSQLAEQLMHFGSSLRGTHSYWNKCRGELSNMINQIGSPTLFFTLSATDTKWPDLHKLFPNGISGTPQTNKTWVENIVNNPHTTSLYLHQRFTIFHEEVEEKFLNAIDYWYRYEWQHWGSRHIHGFIWLTNAPDMDNLDWHNNIQVEQAKEFFDKYVSTWNPRTPSQRNNARHRSVEDDPFLLSTPEIFSRDRLDDYADLLNCV